MRKRRLRKPHAALEVSAFINLIVVLVPFLLTTAVFTRLSVLELSLPSRSSAIEKLSGELQLEVVIRSEALEVGDRIGGLIERIPRSGTGHDLKSLAALMNGLKQRFPQTTKATVLAEPATSYEVIVAVMDSMRAGRQLQGKEVVNVDFFPDLSIGDAPIRNRQARL